MNNPHDAQALGMSQSIMERMQAHEAGLSPFAFRSQQAQRLLPEEVDDLRPAFFHDADRVIYSRAYSRYIDKTQVFYLVENDHITHRVLHVQLVAKVARTLGRFLNLNEDLIEAISLGHDVGHTPFGHNGESLISAFCQRENCGVFQHNVQSFRLFHRLEQAGKGCNLTIQVLDGIICHNGELLSPSYGFDPTKTAQRLLQEYQSSILDGNISAHMIPMTLEGSVMRISDVIAYVGRDFEDAIELGLIQRSDLPQDIVHTLGNSNRSIVNRLVVDLVNNSFEQGSLHFSDDVFAALDAMQRWNYSHIYLNDRKQAQEKKIEHMFEVVLNACLTDLRKGSNLTGIANFVAQMDNAYLDTPQPRIVADYVSGMTDAYMLRTFETLVLPKSFGMGF